ncbi:MAG TPA: hypothetical protein VHB97_14450 [Polyangia bacterium]|jgi:hypothetical protein|nr:hypothetical protein [Polyangia bacterium]
MTRKKKKKRVRVTARAPERHFLGSDEARFRLASRLSSGLGVVLLVFALALSYALPAWNRALGPHANIALRLAGVTLFIVAFMFDRLAKK